MKTKSNTGKDWKFFDTCDSDLPMRSRTMMQPTFQNSLMLQRYDLPNNVYST